MTSQEIRQQFLKFFEKKNHKLVPSAPVVPFDDPTLLFINAGMNQFKDVFLGQGTRDYKRAADTQKCIRVTGKHNDLEEVGMDTYHHTMFEMLGNWSFGDYFKEEAIAWAWELLTKVYKIDKESLYVTYFEGDSNENLKPDTEALKLWKAWLPEARILPGNKQDNFWEMGAQGPCGPCSEIHIDLRDPAEKAKTPGAALVNKDHPLVVEVWNLVFMQYNRKANGSLEPLPQTHVDTGMGFERLCMVLQGKKSNYDTDVFQPLIKEIEAITRTPYTTNEDTAIAIRVIADHLRAVAFSIADGQLPDNSGAGYVIRRILRRAIRYGYTFLDQKQAFIFKLVPTLVAQMADAFPELKQEKNLIVNVIKEEENAFLRTLEQGLALLETLIRTLKTDTLSGDQVFELYDTYGFPFDLTELILRERGLKVDAVGFQKALEAQKQRSRKATQIETSDWVTLLEDPQQEFVGYDVLDTPVRIVKYREVSTQKQGKQYQLVFNLTPFYPEGGGQVGDKGYLKAKNGEVVYIVNTLKENNLIVHITQSLPKDLEGRFQAVVDKNQRLRTAANHTATHLLHQALRNVLGTHVTQKGSMVHSRYLRFDFSHFGKVTFEELKQVEAFVNARIREGILLEENRTEPYADAIARGAMAIFGEKYGDTVRTIQFGSSIELCGGTHVPCTTDVWHFVITSESAVASGIRRIEAITGDAAKAFFEEQAQTLSQIRKLVLPAQDPIKAITSLQEEKDALQKEIQIHLPLLLLYTNLFISSTSPDKYLRLIKQPWKFIKLQQSFAHFFPKMN